MVTIEAKNVVVAKALPLEGRVQVLETWRGDIVAGTTLALPDIAAIASDSRRLVFSQSRPTRNVLGVDRMVLFLGESKSSTCTFARPALLSLLIIEGGKTWAPSLPRSFGGFGDLGLNETELGAQVAIVGALADELEAATKRPTAAARAKALVPLLLSSTSSTIHWKALAALRGCGADAVPVLRDLVRRDAHMALRPNLLALLKEASNDAFVSELHELMARDIRFWKRIAPDLEESWWTGAGASGSAEAEFMRSRVAQTRNLLDWARAANERSTNEAAEELGQLWTSDAQLAPACAWVGLAVAPQAKPVAKLKR